jgi:hypothetical protein
MCDIAGLILKQKEFNWNIVLSQARKMHIERIVLLNVGLAKRLYNVEVPEFVLNARIDIIKDSLDSLVIKEMVLPSPDSFRLSNEMIFWFQARERLLDSFNCILHNAFEPTYVDWLRFPLPSYMYPLYYLIHPIRLIYSYEI